MNNLKTRIKTHIRNGKLDPNTKVKTKEVLGGKTQREISEHMRIQKLTNGVPARFSPNVSNMKDPIGPTRAHLLK